MTFTQQQIRSARTSRALFASVAVELAALALVHLADGARILGALTGFSAALFAMPALLAAHRIGIMKRAVARDEFRERMAVALLSMESPPDWRPAQRSAGPAVARPDSGAVKLDPRWEWKLVQGLGMPDKYVKIRCLHAEVVDVESAADKDTVVAQLCLTCDTQFPAPRED